MTDVESLSRWRWLRTSHKTAGGADRSTARIPCGLPTCGFDAKTFRKQRRQLVWPGRKDFVIDRTDAVRLPSRSPKAGSAAGTELLFRLSPGGVQLDPWVSCRRPRDQHAARFKCFFQGVQHG